MLEAKYLKLVMVRSVDAPSKDRVNDLDQSLPAEVCNAAYLSSETTTPRGNDRLEQHEQATKSFAHAAYNGGTSLELEAGKTDTVPLSSSEDNRSDVEPIRRVPSMEDWPSSDDAIDGGTTSARIRVTITEALRRHTQIMKINPKY